MRVNWLVQRHINDEYCEQLVSLITFKGMTCKTFEVLTSSAEQVADLFREDDCVVFHGSLNFAHALCRLRPYWSIWADDWSFRCSTYYFRLAGYLLNECYVMLPAGDLMRLHKTLRYTFAMPRSGSLFVRPDSGSKPFTGFVWTPGDAEGLELNMRGVESETLVLVAPVKEILREWRIVCDVKNKSFVTGSQYMRQGQVEIDSYVPDAAQEAAAVILPLCSQFVRDPMMTVDVAETQCSYRVLEINSFGAAGWYDSNLESIIICASQRAEEEHQEIWG